MINPTRYFEYDIYLPVLEEEAAKNTIQQSRQELIQHFGGLTITNFASQGEWRIGPVQVRDQIQIWRVISDRGSEGDRFLETLKSRLERDLNQMKILVVKREIEEI